MYILRWLWEGYGYDVSPSVVYWTLRLLMLTLSFVVEDWAIHELVESPRARRFAVLLVSSSYVTWTFQTHTFSNSLETLLVSWSLVLIQQILQDKVRPLRSTCLSGNPCVADTPCRTAPASWPRVFWASSWWWGSSIASPSQPFCFFLPAACCRISGASEYLSLLAHGIVVNHQAGHFP